MDPALLTALSGTAQRASRPGKAARASGVCTAPARASRSPRQVLTSPPGAQLFSLTWLQVHAASWSAVKEDISAFSCRRPKPESIPLSVLWGSRVRCRTCPGVPGAPYEGGGAAAVALGGDGERVPKRGLRLPQSRGCCLGRAEASRHPLLAPRALTRPLGPRGSSPGCRAPGAAPGPGGPQCTAAASRAAGLVRARGCFPDARRPPPSPGRWGTASGRARFCTPVCHLRAET